MPRPYYFGHLQSDFAQLNSHVAWHHKSSTLDATALHLLGSAAFCWLSASFDFCARTSGSVGTACCCCCCCCVLSGTGLDASGGAAQFVSSIGDAAPALCCCFGTAQFGSGATGTSACCCCFCCCCPAWPAGHQSMSLTVSCPAGTWSAASAGVRLATRFASSLTRSTSAAARSASAFSRAASAATTAASRSSIA